MKRLFIVLVAVFLGVLAVAVDTTWAATKLSLSTAEPVLRVNQAFEVVIQIASDDATLGADAVIKYDPEMLELTKVTPGSVYANYSDVGSKDANGVINVSGVADLTEAVSPNGILARLTFVPLKTGKTKVEFVYEADSTSSTGVIPFEGSNGNLITQAPADLSLDVVAASRFPVLPMGLDGVAMGMLGILLVVGAVMWFKLRQPQLPPPTPPAASYPYNV